jgi:hypothetical protein
MAEELRNKYDLLEFIKEIAPEKDLSNINMTELAQKKEQIRDAINESRNRELTVDEKEASDFLEMLLDVELGEEIVNDEIEINVGTDVVQEVVDVVNEDLDLMLGFGGAPLAGAMISPVTIRGGGNYQERLVESSNEWEKRKSNNKSGRGRTTISRGR